MAVHRVLAYTLVLALAVGCSGKTVERVAGTRPSTSRAGQSPAVEPRRPPVKALGTLTERFESYRKYYDGLTVAQLKAELTGETAEPTAFDIERARYYAGVSEALKLAPAELAMLRRQGVVGVDALPTKTMGMLYQFVWTRDLPVLVTTDSVLHALHMSHDLILRDLERNLMASELVIMLDACRKELTRVAAQTPATDTATWTALRDVELELTVGGALLNGAGAEPGEPGPEGDFGPRPSEEPQIRQRPTLGRFAAPRWQSPKDFRLFLDKISRLVVETPVNPTELRGGTRPVDYGQFRARGHYADAASARRYFRAMMWFGRPDTGFIVEPLDPDTGIRVDVERELRAAGTLAYLLGSSGALARWKPVEALLTELAGEYDDIAATELAEALAASGATSWAQIRDAGFVDRVKAIIQRLSSDRSRIRAQTVAHLDQATPAPSPRVLALVPQRFSIDAYLPTTVTYDSILYRGEAVRRFLPSGLDVMAILGNDDAVRLLEPELERYNYAGNLRAARQLVGDEDQAQRRATLPSGWLGVLRTLDDPPSTSSYFPRAMRTRAYRYKQLQTQLASWAQLRHSLLLYAKQPSMAFEACDYPRAFVEPWPETFARLAQLAETVSHRFEALALPVGSRPNKSRSAAGDQADDLETVLSRQKEFFATFARINRKLETLARKELSSQPFTDDETNFLEQTIARVMLGSGPPRWDGWYPKLFYKPIEPVPSWADRESQEAASQPVAHLVPTVADVATDPSDGAVLEAAVGAAKLLVVAVEDSSKPSEITLYVGPVFSYYEFTRPSERRMTDEEWETEVFADRGPERKDPPRPSFVSAFQAPPRYLAVERRPMRSLLERWKRREY
jgi:hypothetical protein